MPRQKKNKIMNAIRHNRWDNFRTNEEEEVKEEKREQRKFICNDYVDPIKFEKLITDGLTMNKDRIMNISIENEFSSGYRWHVIANEDYQLCKVDVTNFGYHNSPRVVKASP